MVVIVLFVCFVVCFIVVFCYVFFLGFVFVCRIFDLWVGFVFLICVYNDGRVI